MQGEVLLHDGMYVESSDVEIIRVKMEGVYVWPFGQLRLVVSGYVHATLRLCNEPLV